MTGMWLADRVVVSHIWIQGCALNRHLLPMQIVQGSSEAGKKPGVEKQRTMGRNRIRKGGGPNHVVSQKGKQTKNGKR